MKQYKFYILPLVFLLLKSYHEVNAKCSYSKPIVQTEYGQLLGTYNASRSNRPFYSFRGIPYAMPPIGELRFKEPKPNQPWDGLYDATKDGNICKQKNYLFSTNPPIEGSEDCLYLNVYTPKEICNLTPKTKLFPVMVFIHYGGYFSGSSHSSLIGPEFFMDKDVVLVTFNYRLGIFGFYSSLDDEAPGNWGFKDQVAALRWVQKNIASFGGDPKSVTIFGQSAGAASVHHHILSPSSQGLFHRGISESGSALSIWARPANDFAAIIFRASAQVAQCDHTADSKTIIECMRNVDADSMVQIADTFRYFSIEPVTVYTIVNENKTERNPEPFIVEDPLLIITKGNFAKVPWIVGVNSDEGILRTSPLLRQSDTYMQLKQNFDTLCQKILLLDVSLTNGTTEELWQQYKKYYMNGKDIDINDPKTVQGFTNLYSDRSFIHGSYQSALIHSYLGHSPIWFYNFDYKGSLSYGDVFAATKENINFDWGTSHCDELIYLFNSPALFPKLNAKDRMMSKTLIKIWTDFASHSEPTPIANVSKFERQGWESIPNITGTFPIENHFLHYLNIKGSKSSLTHKTMQLEMRNDFLNNRMAFLNSLSLKENIPGFN
ncbi:PREDICTED: venom carboxylesterase-6-like isoform X2 [Nicrophorus vespilloides]|nr:PREDICTED: venom carboxylesterase-6-like isoform X2 [Nicrophorus vespilloides]XP_017783233.1 PREDICTED: venom carboxylesterase-6-like isoform X2 [Nicrophorus vespilloides]